MSLKKQGFLLPLAQFLEWIGLKKLPAQDPEWLEGEDRYPVGLDEDGTPCELEVHIDSASKLFVSQSDVWTPWLDAKLIFNGVADGAIKPLDVLVEKLVFPAHSGTPCKSIESPPERDVKALCQGFYLAVTNQTPIGTDANPLDRIESGAAADDLDARMAAVQQQVDPYANAGSVAKRMFG